jgi:PST family polysaccharide transporter
MNQGFGPEAIVLGMILGDFSRLFMSWTFFRIPTVPNMNFHVIQDLITFGKWIWGAGVITVLLNQIDKILVVKFLGVLEFSFYQMSSRIAQLIITDGPILFGQYQYPNFCERNRISRLTLNMYFKKILIFTIFVAIFPLIFLEVSAPILVQSFFGEDWKPMIKLIRLMAIPMYFGAIIAILIPYIRAIGKPSIIANATILQFISLCVFSVPLIYFYQLTGMIMAISLAGLTAMLYLVFNIFPFRKIILSFSKEKL